MSSYQSSSGLIVGVDVGGTKTAVLVTDSQYRALSQTALPTVVDHPEATLQRIVEAISQAVGDAGANVRDIAAVGLGIPGRVEPSTGIVRKAVNLGWHELPVGSMLAAQIGAPCILENDVRVAALGSQHYLGVDAPANMLYLGIGTGIAAGLVLNGELYRGTHSLAGEVGHMVIEPGGPRCACGAHGCLEALAAGPAIARQGQQAALESPGSVLNGPEKVTTEAVFAAAQAGDSAAIGVTQRVAGYIALALQQLIMAYDVECIYIGGGVSHAGDAFLRPVRTELARLREGSPLQSEMLSEENIRLVPEHYNAGTWGAVVLAGRLLV